MTPWENTPNGPTLIFNKPFQIRLTANGDFDRFKNLSTSIRDQQARTITVTAGTVTHEDNYLQFHDTSGGRTFIRKEFVEAITDSTNDMCWPCKVP
ncbi:MAG TPA: hypothetical protein PLF31_03615 [Candidatus Paceibacterota bacterium]|nr:hypothetical protein [Candidatus Paceibacterota bacterium]